MSLSLSQLRTANRARQRRWDPDSKITLLFWSTALAGEVGEACNVVKKLERQSLGLAGSATSIDALREELADVLIYLDLLADAAGIDLSRATIEKFNSSSTKLGLKVFLGTGEDTSHAAGVPGKRPEAATAAGEE
ncbi:MAG: MazG-like family protein [Hyphomicrobiaceae bacterium]|nr:MazG-like family protein [Hyphomicrobiaceae bacterium]MCC0024599.1 nucleotide pyrophosphohydrolase [Hyphomicrobiaceae bacterium]